MNEINKNDFSCTSQFINIGKEKIHYLEQGKGDPILFLHGIPTSSYSWRKILPYLSSLGKCIAPDLIGFGKSSKPDIQYTITDHINYIEKFIEALGLKNITLVMHGWGSVIGLDYAMRHENKCKGIVFYEAYLRGNDRSEISLPYEEQLLSLEELEETHDIINNAAQIVERILSQCYIGKLPKNELTPYLEPFLPAGSGQPLKQYLQELPNRKGKNKINAFIENYSSKLKQSPLPKLMLYSIPGFITTIETVKWAKENISNLEAAEVGEELHYAQESNPILMGQAISIWLQGVEQQIAS